MFERFLQKWLSGGGTIPDDIEFDPYFFEQLSGAKHLVALTGAGISAESGIPTFREEGGLWEKFRPEELASMEAFLNNPERVSDWYAHRRDIINHTSPNNGHMALAALENEFKYVTVITQNIDGLHQQAGSTNVIELHGNIHRNYCVSCGKRYDYDNFTFDSGIPKCDDCGGLVRPDVVWFGEPLSRDAIEEAERYTASADVMFSIGTSGVVYPAAGLPKIAKSHQAYLVEINPNHTDISLIADETFHGKAGEVLPQILRRYQQWKNA